MNGCKIARILSFFIALVGSIIAIGWIFGIKSLEGSMYGLEPKFTTAVSFVAGSIIIYFLSKKEGERSFTLQAVLPSAILLIFLLMATTLVSTLLGVEFGIDSFFAEENIGGAGAPSSVLPSMATMICFVLVGMVGVMEMIDPVKFTNYQIIIGVINIFVGIAVIFGYFFDLPFLYFKIGPSAAMAFATAILFILSGIAIILCKNSEYKQN